MTPRAREQRSGVRLLEQKCGLEALRCCNSDLWGAGRGEVLLRWCCSFTKAEEGFPELGPLRMVLLSRYECPWGQYEAGHRSAAETAGDFTICQAWEPANRKEHSPSDHHHHLPVSQYPSILAQSNWKPAAKEKWNLQNLQTQHHKV